jgi:hypothetical protein
MLLARLWLSCWVRGRNRVSPHPCRRRYELTEEERQSKRSPEELRGDLMAKIKRDNTEVEQMTAQVWTLWVVVQG